MIPKDCQKWHSADWSQNKIADYKPYTVIDGEGVRCSVYVSGCLFACKGCYNVVAQNFNYGQEYNDELEQRILSDIGASYCQGLTLLGGEPFLNTSVTIRLCKALRECYGTTKDIWSWSGYTYEELLEGSEDKRTLLEYIDILVDGKFELSEFEPGLRFRGSRNQRIIHVPESLETGTVVLWHNGHYED